MRSCAHSTINNREASSLNWYVVLVQDHILCYYLLASKSLFWFIEKGIIERINTEDGKKKAFGEGCLSLLGNKSQQIKILLVDMFEIVTGEVLFFPMILS